MTQTTKGQNGTPQKQVRPGQRQQERLMRLARRRRRRRIWTASITAVLLIVIASVSLWQYQRYTAQQAADKAAKATAVAIAHANATGTAVVQNCFIAPVGTKTDNFYSATTTPTAGPTTAPLITGTPTTTSDGLKYIDINVGTGPAARTGSTLSVEYTGWLANGCNKFDSSYDHGGQPFDVTLGQGQVIKGFDEGLVGMKKGGTRRLYIPPALGYGDKGAGQTIPPGATLIFDITVVSIK